MTSLKVEKYLPAAPNRYLCLAVRWTYLMARRRYESLSKGHTSFRIPIDWECQSPTPYEKYINRVIKFGLNPIHVILTDYQRIFEQGYSSDVPRLEKLGIFAYSAQALSSDFNYRSKVAINSAHQSISLKMSTLDVMFNSNNPADLITVMVNAKTYEVDPVILSANAESFGVALPRDLKRAAYSAYLSAPNVYKVHAKVDLPNFLVSAPTFNDWVGIGVRS
jgi:hypothetical protein